MAGDGIEISTDPERLDRELVHRFLRDESYWARGVEREVVDRSIEGSIPFGVYDRDRQVGFARALTDGATFAWIADLFVLDSHRGRGIGKRLVEAIVEHPDVRGARRVLLATDDAHGLYRRFGFLPLARPERYMLRASPEAEGL
jgi:GNAT superfamily N-acetyltransferase